MKRILSYGLALALAIMGTLLVPEFFGADGGVMLASGLLTGVRKITPAPLFAQDEPHMEVMSQRNTVLSHTLGLDYDYTTAGTAVGAYYGDASHRVASNIIVRGMLGGKTETFINMAPRHLLAYLVALQDNVRPQTEPSEAAVATKETDLRSEIELIYTALGVNDPEQFALPAQLLDRGTLEIAVAWANGNALVSGEAGVAAVIDNTDRQLYEEYVLSQGMAAVRGSDPARKVARMHTITAAGDDVELELPSMPRGSELLRAWTVGEADDAAVDTVVTDAGLVVDGEEHFQKLDVGVYRRNNVRDLPGLSQLSDFVGTTFFDFVRDGSAGRGNLPRIQTNEKAHILANVATPGAVNKVYVCAEYVTRK